MPLANGRIDHCAVNFPPMMKPFGMDKPMLDFQPVREKKISLQDLVKDLTKDDLQRELNAMYDEISRLIADCSDSDVIFEPRDEKADDPYAIQGEESIAWTLGHVIVHLTASMEESAAIASELARGVAYHGRSRWEVPWRDATTIEFCRARLEESRRMCLASLEVWPDVPYMENTYSPAEGAVPHTAVSRFASGLRHASDHLGQITEIVRQAKVAL